MLADWFGGVTRAVTLALIAVIVILVARLAVIRQDVVDELILGTPAEGFAGHD